MMACTESDTTITYADMRAIVSYDTCSIALWSKSNRLQVYTCDCCGEYTVTYTHTHTVATPYFHA